MAENEEKGVFLNFLAGIGVGAIAGAITALMMAPKSGVETREDLKKAVQDLSKSTEDLRKRSIEMLEVAKTRATEAYEAGRETIKKRTGGEAEAEAEAEEASPEA